MVERLETIFGKQFKIREKVRIGQVPIHVQDEVLIVEGTACVQAVVESVHTNGAVKLNSPFLKDAILLPNQEIEAVYCPH